MGDVPHEINIGLVLKLFLKFFLDVVAFAEIHEIVDVQAEIEWRIVWYNCAFKNAGRAIEGFSSYRFQYFGRFFKPMLG